jgi:NAD(P)-dependent dehydrogenase (short-subunit alcohol dehydrogenase family)
MLGARSHRGLIDPVRAAPGFGTYSASKAAIRSFARSWTVDLKDRKILVNVLSGTIDTGMFDNIAAEVKELFVSLIRSAALANPAKSQPPPCPWHRTIRR